MLETIVEDFTHERIDCKRALIELMKIKPGLKSTIWRKVKKVLELVKKNIIGTRVGALQIAYFWNEK